MSQSFALACVECNSSSLCDCLAHHVTVKGWLGLEQYGGRLGGVMVRGLRRILS
ncbi:hypothetical protein ACWY4P_00905 [Streptomyces sp. LZ34]